MRNQSTFIIKAR